MLATFLCSSQFWRLNSGMIVVYGDEVLSSGFKGWFGEFVVCRVRFITKECPS